MCSAAAAAGGPPLPAEQEKKAALQQEEPEGSVSREEGREDKEQRFMLAVQFRDTVIT